MSALIINERLNGGKRPSSIDAKCSEMSDALPNMYVIIHVVLLLFPNTLHQLKTYALYQAGAAATVWVSSGKDGASLGLFRASLTI